MYTYCKQYGNKVLLRDTDNIKPMRVTKHSWNVYFEDLKGEYKSIHKRALRKDTYETVKAATDAKKMNENYLKVYGAKTFGYQYIRDKYLGKTPVTPKDLYIANIDIETGRDKKGYSSPEEARCPITSITLHDISADRYIVWGYHKDGYIPKSDNVVYVNCNHETDMMYKFVGYIASKYPDIITGWNVEQYDVTYIINRLGKLFEDRDDMVAALSPFGIVNEREIHDAFGKTKQAYDIVGISTLDYLNLFKKFTYKTPENYKLDTVAHLILKDNKIDYSEYANLQDLFEKNYEKFIDYNIKDTTIVARLDDKLKLFDLVLSIAYKAGINYNDVVSPVQTWDVLIYNSIMDKGIVPSCEMPNAEGGAYIGGYVKEPETGMYNWIVSCDLNSLYPHLQMGLNISTEKRVQDHQLPQDLLDIRDSLITTEMGINKLLDEKIDTSALKKYNVSLAPNGQFYKRDSDGIVPIILEGLYNERKTVKRSMLDDKQKMQDDKNLNITNQIEAKNTLQMALKILMNAEYGALANKYFRYFELRNAEAITSSGQLAILWVAKHLNIFLNRILKTEEEDYVIAIDTDSVYLNLEYLVDKFVRPKVTSTENVVNILDGWSSNILEPEIARIYGELAEYVNAHKQKMNMSREVIADKGFWTGKKRYALNVHDSEGVRYTEPDAKVMGLECVRSSVPEFCRIKIKKCIDIILTKSEADVQDFILETKDEFFKQLPENIAFPRGTNNIEKWVDHKGMPKRGTPIHVRGCIVYNLYLDKNKFTDEKIQSGDKIKFCYIKKPNIFKSHVLSFPPSINRDVYNELQSEIDYEQQWYGTFFKPINAIMQCIGWSAERINSVLDFCTGESY